MKLNYKRTIFVGFAFFLICSFWQAYDNTIPLILTNKFGMSQAWSGVIMALDNVLALFMLPLFGAISDKHHSKWGRRTPFIVVGTLIAAVMLIALSFVDNAQLRHLSDVSAIDDPAALEQIYDRQANETLLTPSGDKFVLSQKFTQEEFCQIRSQVEQNGSTVTNPDYTNYVVPARQACAWDATAKSPVTLVFFIVLLLIVLVSMAVFRSPAVALMPDVTLKPLRSKANAVINLMGSAGGILVLALGMVFATSAVRNSLMSYTGYFAVIAAIMLVALVIFMLTVREKEWAYEMQQQAVALGIEEETQEQEEAAGGRKLSVDEVRSLILLLLSIVLWFFGYNAVTSKYSVYASNILHKDYNLTLIIAQAAAIVSYLPDAAWLPDWMRVEQLVEMFRDFYADFDPAKANEMLEKLELSPKAPLKSLSKGNKEKVQLILAMSRNARLYLLDEPIGGVDPAARDYILNTILTNYSRDASVIISTHLIEDVEPVLDEAVFLKNGRIFAHRSVDELRETEGMSVDAYFREVFKC